MAERARLLIWAEPDQRTLIEDALAAAGAEAASVGSATADGAAALARGLGVDPFDDLRAAIHREDVDVLWLVAPDPIAPDIRRLIRDVGMRAITSQPRPLSIAELGTAPAEARTAQFVPLLRRSPGYRRAQDVLEQIGEIQCVDVGFACNATEGTLVARLFDAMDLLSTLCGEAESIAAALVGAPEPGVPEDLDRMHGHLAVNVRFEDQRAASVTVSDRGGAWNRHVTILASGGRLSFTDDDLDWVSADGATVDRHVADERLGAGHLVGLQIDRVLAERDTPEAPPDTARLLALCEAARLSCRTGEEESPVRMLEMLSRP
ncbi:MAG: Gfo/Idh/MocA family oxidoreductase [Planctomycetota bacterium]|jgi:predicted dehydrogenase